MSALVLGALLGADDEALPIVAVEEAVDELTTDETALAVTGLPAAAPLDPETMRTRGGREIHASTTRNAIPSR